VNILFKLTSNFIIQTTNVITTKLWT